MQAKLPDDIKDVVSVALNEDIGSGDLTSSLIDSNAQARACVIAREQAILCGIEWFNEVYRQIDSSIEIRWLADEGNQITANQNICNITGPASKLLTGERTALNFLQLLSGTATRTHEMVELISDLDTRLLDTRKTIPGLRKAQKYAVLCGGGQNHRMGLYDAILIKENHIAAAGDISSAIKKAKEKKVPIEIEVESLDELQQALAEDVNRILLDNFSIDEIRQAVELTNGRTALEASGNINKENIRQIAETGVDYISIGSLTKHLAAIDFSMQFEKCKN